MNDKSHGTLDSIFLCYPKLLSWSAVEEEYKILTFAFFELL